MFEVEYILPAPKARSTCWAWANVANRTTAHKHGIIANFLNTAPLVISLPGFYDTPEEAVPGAGAANGEPMERFCLRS